MHDVVIVGAGTAALSAGLYAARLDLDTVIVDEVGPGGQLLNAGDIDPHPGAAEGTSGPDFIGRLTEQVTERGVEFEFGAVTGVRAGDRGFVLDTEVGSLEARALIVASGAKYQRLGIIGEHALYGRGLSHCAVCDGAFFRDQHVAVVGSGDAALQSVAELAGTAASITLIHRGSTFTGTPELAARILDAPGVTVIPDTEVEAITGDDSVSGLVLRTQGNQATSELPVTGVFVNVGTVPRTGPFGQLLEVDETGRIVVDLQMATSVPGIYAAGAARAGTPDQIATAIGDGVTAALSAGNWVRGLARSAGAERETLTNGTR